MLLDELLLELLELLALLLEALLVSCAPCEIVTNKTISLVILEPPRID